MSRLPKTLMAAALAATTLAPLADAASSVFVFQNGNSARIVTSTSDLRQTMRPFFPGLVARAPVRHYSLKLDCIVAGTPVEFPNDIRISNPYNFGISAGTVSYTAPFGNAGTVSIPALGPGQGFYVSNAVPGGITAGAACSASTM